MNPSFEVTEKVIIRRFTGKVSVHRVIKSWEYILHHMGVLDKYRGVVTDLLDAELAMNIEDLDILMNYLNEKLIIFGNLKLAVLLNNEKVILPILADKKQSNFKIKPFATEEAALAWINS